MNTRNLIQTSLFAAILAAGAAAQAAPMGEGDSAQTQAQQVHSTRTFKQAQAASLASVSRQSLWNYDAESYGMGPVPVQGDYELSRTAVRTAAIQAQRAGKIEHGDAASF